MHNAAHYMQERRANPLRFALAFVGGLLLVALGAIVYVRLGRQFDTMHLRIALLVAASAGAAGISAGVVRIGRVPATSIATLVGALLGLICLYVMWLVWVHDIFARAGLPPKYSFLIQHPGSLYRVICDLNREGTWSYQGERWRGIPLLIVWLAEAGAIVGSSVAAAVLATQRGQILCRACNSKCQRIRGLRRFAADRQDEFVAAVENRQFDELSDFEPRMHEDDPELSLELVCCTKCDQTNVLSVNRVAWTIDNSGRSKVQIRPLIERMIITADEAEKLKILKDEENKTDANPSEDETPRTARPDPSSRPA